MTDDRSTRITEPLTVEDPDTPRENLALTRALTELPHGLWMLRDLGDRSTLLYPTAVIHGIQQVYEERLRREKAACLRALDQLDAQQRRIETMITTAARMRAQIDELVELKHRAKPKRNGRTSTRRTR